MIEAVESSSLGRSYATVPQMLSQLADLYGDEPALSSKVDGIFTAISYRELDRKALALAAAMGHVLGVQKGELVALVCNNRAEWMICSLAIHFAGAVDVPRASDTPSEILEAILRHAEPAVVILENQAQLEKVRTSLPALRAVVLVDAHPQTAGASPTDVGCSVHTLDELLLAGEGLLPEHGGDVEQRRAAVAPGDLATVIYTSGTTGTPKGVALTHGNYMLNINSLPAMLGIDRERVLSILQPWHAYERQVQLMCLSAGCCIYYRGILALRGDLKAVRPTLLATVPELWVTLYKGAWQKIAAEKPAKQRLARFLIAHSLAFAKARRVLAGREPLLAEEASATRFWRRLTAFASTALNWPAHALADRLVYRELRANLGGELRFAIVGGGPLPDTVDEFFDAAGLPLIEGYGMTEAIVVMAIRGQQPRVLRTAGPMLDGMDYKIEGDDGRQCGTGEVGRLRVRGPNVMRGYYRDDELTAQVLDGEGWLATGDLARRHADGSIRVLSRIDDTLVLSTGKNVNAVYVENELRASEGVDRAVVVGAGKPYAAAFIVPTRAQLERLAVTLTIGYHDVSELLESPRIIEHYEEIARRITGDASKFAPHERVQRVRLWLGEFRAGREISQTLKLRRREFYCLYATEIEALYAD